MVMSMELVDGNDKRKIYRDGNRIYTMINMGDYVHHRSREWYEKAPENWFLMYYDEYQDNEIIRHIETLVDQNGHYMRYIINQGTESVIILLPENKEIYSKIKGKENVPHLPKSQMLNHFLQKNWELKEEINNKKTK